MGQGEGTEGHSGVLLAMGELRVAAAGEEGLPEGCELHQPGEVPQSLCPSAGTSHWLDPDGSCGWSPSKEAQGRWRRVGGISRVNRDTPLFCFRTYFDLSRKAVMFHLLFC